MLDKKKGKWKLLSVALVKSRNQEARVVGQREQGNEKDQLLRILVGGGRHS